MNDAFGVDNHIDLLIFQAEKPFGLDHLEPFVHQRRAIDRDSGAHSPVGMLESMGGLYVHEEICLASQEWPPGGSQDHLLDHSRVLSGEALKYSAVLAVD